MKSGRAGGLLTAMWMGLKDVGATGTSATLLSGANSMFSMSLAGGGAGNSSSACVSV